MSQENVQIVRRALDLLGRGDIAALLDLAAPEFELDENVLAPDAAVYHGRDGLRRWFEVSQEAFMDFRFETERFVESGEWVFAFVHVHGRGRGSGAPFTASYVTALRIRHGKVVVAASYSDLSEALEAVGLSE
jgi:ketosteroid isomerase-like protein